MGMPFVTLRVTPLPPCRSIHQRHIPTPLTILHPPLIPSATLSALLACNPCTAGFGRHDFGAAPVQAGSSNLVGARL
ncbi:hypothetical protein CXB36_24135 [Pseudomonas syringae pv. syringae]|nr:hypothetical protein BKC06_003185 [Pseudomonas syringae pv. syringae]PBP38531.1 hypothetical protein CCL11_22280 [Pseudomonas syringae]PBP71623.1 hypothetical protein CCL21_07460 [Pseudomonas syringae]PBP87110.1 hypothetical protein CCL16_13050 [Pseudomonas syringae]POP62269.1 hypothetical protein CXB36_24135 [Pseudomonas syringae pv. syringae]